jgi:hypothetical protein
MLEQTTSCLNIPLGTEAESGSGQPLTLLTGCWLFARVEKWVFSHSIRATISMTDFGLQLYYKLPSLVLNSPSDDPQINRHMSAEKMRENSRRK